MERWIKSNDYAQLIGILMREFNFKFSDFEDMTALQFYFLISWLKWFNEKIERRMRKR